MKQTWATRIGLTLFAWCHKFEPLCHYCKKRKESEGKPINLKKKQTYKHV